MILFVTCNFIGCSSEKLAGDSLIPFASFQTTLCHAMTSLFKPEILAFSPSINWMDTRGLKIQENRIGIYCDIFSLYCDILRYIPFLIFSVKLH